MRKLSLGQRIRCEIAGSLIHSPSIVFLDEPSIGLDIIAKQKLRGFIRRINREEGVTVFLTSHDADDIEHICRRVIVINRGTVVWDGSVNTMKYHLLGRRILDIELQETPNAQERAEETAQEIKAMNLQGLTIVKAEGNSLKLELDIARNNPGTVVSRIMEHSPIADMSISTTPVEEIITMIYQGAI